mgnify:CR=1 FL=1
MGRLGEPSSPSARPQVVVLFSLKVVLQVLLLLVALVVVLVLMELALPPLVLPAAPLKGADSMSTRLLVALCGCSAATAAAEEPTPLGWLLLLRAPVKCCMVCSTIWPLIVR